MLPSSEFFNNGHAGDGSKGQSRGTVASIMRMAPKLNTVVCKEKGEIFGAIEQILTSPFTFLLRIVFALLLMSVSPWLLVESCIR